MTKITLSALVILLMAGYSNAQITKKAQVGFRFLENPVSAEAVGRGTTGIMTTLNSNSIFWNPALLGLIESSVDVNLNYTKGIADINYNAAAASVKLGDFGVLGFSLLYMDYGTFYGTVSLGDSYVETGTFSPQAYAIGMAFSQKLTDRFSYGIHLKYFYQDLGDAVIALKGTSPSDTNLVLGKKHYDSRNFNLPIAADVGAIYDFHYNGIKFGASLQNISREYHYDAEDFPLPFAINFGATVEPLGFFNYNNPDHKLVLSFESRHPRDFGEKLKIGAEYTFINSFILRTGYMTNYDGRAFTFGAGVRQEISGIPFRVDYAYEPWDIFGGVHFITVGISY
ncbi:MAG TPA: PorV/PorQ family protein [Ignavibacteriales bacterium]|nr:PorV/PorQ family protein [Ignavibacteriales bacterium]